MKTNNRIVCSLLILCTFLLSSCASKIQSIKSELNKSSLCCDDLSQIEYTPLKVKQSFELSDGKRVRRFGKQVSYFQAFALGDQQVAAITVQSYIAGMWLPESHVVIPNVWLLDEQFQPMGPEKLPLSWDSDYWKGGYLKGQINIPKQARYIILFAEQGTEGATITFKNYTTNSVPIYTGSGTIYVPSGTTESIHEIPYGPDGELKLFAKLLP